MAPRLRKSAAIIVTGCALTMILVQLFQPARVGWDFSNPYIRRIQDLAQRASVAEMHQAQYVMMDSLLPKLPAANGVMIDKSPLISDSVTKIDHLVRDQLRGFSDVKARIGVFIVAPDAGHYGRTNSYRRENRLTYFAGVDKAGPYCAVVVQAPTQRAPKGLYVTGLHYVPQRVNPSTYIPKSNVLGPCVFWARYGAPGPRVQQWLENGGYRFASARADALWDKWPQTYVTGGQYYSDPTPLARGCRAGRTNFCTAAVLEPSSRAPASDVRSDEYFARESVFGNPADGGLLAYAERQYGAGPFEKFWKSDKDVEPAFASAFGTPMAPWIQNIAQTYFGTIKATPRLNAGAILLSLLLILTLCFVAVRLSQQRQIL